MAGQAAPSGQGACRREHEVLVLTRVDAACQHDHRHGQRDTQDKRLALGARRGGRLLRWALRWGLGWLSLSAIDQEILSFITRPRRHSQQATSQMNRAWPHG